QERLQKIIAHAGYASRREAEAMMRAGRITLNGRVVTELGTRADPERDHIKVDGKLITRAEEHRYIIIYKPKEVMTTVEDPQDRRRGEQLVGGEAARRTDAADPQDVPGGGTSGVEAEARGHRTDLRSETFARRMARADEARGEAAGDAEGRAGEAAPRGGQAS